MLAKEKGVLSGSDLYFMTPSDNARDMLFYLTACGYYYTNADYLIQRETYQSYLIIYLCDGQMSVSTGGKRQLIKAGQICFLDCYDPHEYRSMGHAEFIWAHVAGSNISAFHKRVIQNYGSYVFSASQHEEIRKQLFAFTYAVRNNQEVSEWKHSDQIYHLLILMLDQAGKTDAALSDRSVSAATRQAMEYIRIHYDQQLSLEQIANEVSMSQFHFSRVFKRECGYSPHEFLIITRMDRAMYLLKTTDLPVKAISAQVGYQNETTFTNAFTGRIGLSPGKFRKFPI